MSDFPDGKMTPTMQVRLQHVLQGDKAVWIGLSLAETQALAEAVQDHLVTKNYPLFTHDTLLTAIQMLQASLELSEVLDHMLGYLHQVAPYTAIHIMLINNVFVEIVRSHGYEEGALRDFENTLAKFYSPYLKTPPLEKILQTKHPLLIENIKDYYGWEDDFLNLPEIAYLGIPLLFDDQVLGFINLSRPAPDFFTEKLSNHLQTYARHAALAIRNAQRCQQIKNEAVSAAHQRISHDLHDNLSQILFASTVLTETLPRLLSQDEPKLLTQLDRLKRLNRAALAEARNLLQEFELDGFSKEALQDMLHQLAEGAMGKSAVKIRVKADNSYPPPLEVQVGFYKVAQTVLKQLLTLTQPQEVKIILLTRPENAILYIVDKGDYSSHFLPLAARQTLLESLNSLVTDMGAVLKRKRASVHEHKMICSWCQESQSVNM